MSEQKDTVEELFGKPTAEEEAQVKRTIKISGVEVDKTKFSRDLIAKTVGVEVRVATHGVTRTVDSKKVVEFQGEVEGGENPETGELVAARKASRERTMAGKKILDSPELKKISALRNRLGREISAIAMETSLFGSGSYLVSAVSVQRVKAHLDEFQSKFWPLVDEFIEKYEGYVNEARESLGPLFDPTDYLKASLVRGEFGFDYRFFTFDTPAALQSISSELFAQEQARAAEKAEIAWTEIVQGLRVGFAELVNDFNDKLAPRADGKKKAFKEMYIEKILAFIGNFREKNITNDTELEELVNQAEQALQGISAQDVSKKKDVRETITETFEQLRNEADEMIVEKSRRIIVKKAAA
jgi:hypothetical protein